MKRKLFLIIFSILPLLSFSQQSKNNLKTTFQYFCQLFEKNYASFEEKGIHWADTCKKYEQFVNESITDKKLYAIFKKMLSPLNDAHITLRAERLDSAFSASRTSRIINELKPIPGKERRNKFNAMIWKTLNQKAFKPFKEIGPKYQGERLFAYTDNGEIGYVRFYRSFGSDSFFKGWFLNQQIKKVFKSLTKMDAIIIDIRFNIGGNDGFSQKIAGHFVDKPTIGFYKQTRKSGKFDNLITKYIQPQTKKAFNQPVILLTNDKTVSAADVLALMLSSLPKVTLIGEPSNGSYSDLMADKLPNGWRITLSNQRYLSVNKVNYEGKGTPVDIEVLNTLKDVQNQEDSVLEAAFGFLKK